MPISSVKLYKHSSQFFYNTDKGGLDENTALNEKIHCSVKLQFEQKFIYRMLNGIGMINSWHIEQGRRIILPYIEHRKNKGKLISINKLRKKSSEYPLETHTYQLSIQILKYIDDKKKNEKEESNKNSFNNKEKTNENLERVLKKIKDMRATNSFPVKWSRLQTFYSNPDLDFLRSSNFAHFCHQCISTSSKDKKKKDSRGICVLSYNYEERKGKRTSFSCSVCEVPLCRQPFKGSHKDSLSCFDRWHNCENLKITASKVLIHWLQIEQKLRNKKKEDKEKKKKLHKKKNTIQQSADQVLKKHWSNNNSAIKCTEVSMPEEKTKESELTSSVLSMPDQFDDVYAILNMNNTLTQTVTERSDTDEDSTTKNNNKTTIPSLQTTPTSVKTKITASSPQLL